LFRRARALRLIEDRPQASIDSTGLDSHYVSRHFLWRQGKRTKRYRRWTKLTIVAHHGSHLIVSAHVSVGPDNDSPHLPPAVREALRRVPIDRLFGDAAYDSEDHHRLCRRELGIRSTIFALNHRGSPRCPGTRYRRQMHQHFPRGLFGQRWQVESVISRLKRHLGSSLRSRSHQNRTHECLVRVLTYNLMILLFTC